MQSTNSLTLTTVLLVAQHDPGYLPIRQGMSRLRHGQSTPTSSRRSSDLPSSDSNTCILVVVDRFSKACKLIPLPGLPTAFETAEMLFSQIFRHFGIPEDIVSDRGPQFISRVWKSFFNLLGVSISLTSGYHPQFNGQSEDPGNWEVPAVILS